MLYIVFYLIMVYMNVRDSENDIILYFYEFYFLLLYQIYQNCYYLILP